MSWPRITVEEILKLRPCKEYTKEYLEELFEGRKYMDAGDVSCYTDVCSEDRLWLLLRMLPVELHEYFIQDCFDRIMELCKGSGVCFESITEDVNIACVISDGSRLLQEMSDWCFDYLRLDYEDETNRQIDLLLSLMFKGGKDENNGR